MNSWKVRSRWTIDFMKEEFSHVMTRGWKERATLAARMKDFG